MSIFNSNMNNLTSATTTNNAKSTNESLPWKCIQDPQQDMLYLTTWFRQNSFKCSLSHFVLKSSDCISYAYHVWTANFWCTVSSAELTICWSQRSLGPGLEQGNQPDTGASHYRRLRSRLKGPGNRSACQRRDVVSKDWALSKGKLGKQCRE